VVIKINNDISDIMESGSQIVQSIRKKKSINLRKFIKLWNIYVLKEKWVTDEMKDLLNLIFGLTDNRLLRKRGFEDKKDWLLADLDCLPSIVRDQLSKKRSTYKFHKWWIMAKTLDIKAPFYFVHRGKKTFIILHDKRSFSNHIGFHPTHIGRYMGIIRAIATEVTSKYTKMSIERKFNLTDGKIIGKTTTRNRSISIYIMKYDFSLIDDFLALTYYTDLKRIPTNNTIHSQYYGSRDSPKHIFTYELQNSSYCGTNLRYLIYTIDENKALRDFILSIILNEDFKRERKLLKHRYSDLSDEKILFLSLKRKFKTSSLNIAREWNKFRIKEAKLLKFDLKGISTSIYTVDNACEHLRYISRDVNVFLNEDRNRSFTQFIEALMEECFLREAMNKEFPSLNLEKVVKTKHIGKHNNIFQDNIATLPDIVIYPEKSLGIEFVLAKRYRGIFGIDSKGNFADDFLTDMMKSFQDPFFNARHFNCGIFAYKDILNDSSVINSIPDEIIEMTRNNKAGMCLIGYWNHGPAWMSRFGELFSATRAELFITDSNNKSKLKVSNINEVEDEIRNRFSRGSKILNNRQRKQINTNQWKLIMEILDIADSNLNSIHYWINEVIYRFIVKIFRYLTVEKN
jgi:hypothetical protein